MILSKETILREMSVGNLLISPFRAEQLNPNSYDLRLGRWFYYCKLINGVRTYFGPKQFSTGDIIPIPHGIGFLGMTEEIISSPHHVGLLKAKSTTGRSFLSVCNDAGLGDIGYKNHWTLEIVNFLAPVNYCIVGETFAQIVFEFVTPTETSYGGQYEGTFPECMIPKAYRATVQPWNEKEEAKWRSFLHQ